MKSLWYVLHSRGFTQTDSSGSQICQPKLLNRSPWLYRPPPARTAFCCVTIQIYPQQQNLTKRKQFLNWKITLRRCSRLGTGCTTGAVLSDELRRRWWDLWCCWCTRCRCTCYRWACWVCCLCFLLWVFSVQSPCFLFPMLRFLLGGEEQQREHSHQTTNDDAHRSTLNKITKWDYRRKNIVILHSRHKDTRPLSSFHFTLFVSVSVLDSTCSVNSSMEKGLLRTVQFTRNSHLTMRLNAINSCQVRPLDTFPGPKQAPESQNLWRLVRRE